MCAYAVAARSLQFISLWINMRVNLVQNWVDSTEEFDYFCTYFFFVAIICIFNVKSVGATRTRMIHSKIIALEVRLGLRLPCKKQRSSTRKYLILKYARSSCITLNNFNLSLAACASYRIKRLSNTYYFTITIIYRFLPYYTNGFDPPLTQNGKNILSNLSI